MKGAPRSGERPTADIRRGGDVFEVVYEPLLPDERMRIAWSMGIGLVLLAVLMLLNQSEAVW